MQSPVGAHGIGPGAFLALIFLLFPLLPLFFFPLGFVEFGLHSSECLEKMGSCAVPLIAYCTIFVAVFIGLWKLIPLQPFNKSSLKLPSDKSRLNIEGGRIAASAHLLDPTYIVDYAKAEGLNLDDVFTLVRKGQLFSYWHKGILFVARSKFDEPNPSLQGTRDEATLL